MEVYLIIYKSEYHTKQSVISFNNDEEAISCASDIASKGKYEINEDNYIRNATLVNIIKFSLKTLKGIECDFVLEKGRFVIKERKQRKNS